MSYLFIDYHEKLYYHFLEMELARPLRFRPTTFSRSLLTDLCVSDEVPSFSWR